MDHFFESIHGWFDYADIYKEAVEKAHDGDCFVEVGTYAGKSAAFMAVEIVNSKKKIDFFAVDRWDGILEGRDIPITLDTFIDNMARGGCLRVATPLRMLSIQASRLFIDNSLGFVYIDADHDYESVRQDIGLWRNKVRPGGTLAGHDFGRSGVSKAVEYAFHKNEIEIKGYSWIWRKR